LRFKFDPDLDYISVNIYFVGEQSYRSKAALDTGANALIVPKHLASRLGLQLSITKSQIWTVDAHHLVSKVIIPEVTLLGHTLKNIAALVYDLPDMLGVDALVGLQFLRKFTSLSIHFSKSYVELVK
jgi:predicted aspartyl protease